ncbi:MAG: hypothetical protein JWN30_892, partial [Bacilli bacterium]|nr:hypothetical protein [Bacilli bacterium]
MQTEYVFRDNHTLLLEINDHLDFPLFWWPRTLVQFPISFAGTVLPEQILLLDANTGQQIPYQLSEVKMNGEFLSFARVHFFADLPSGGKRVYQLSKTSQSAYPSFIKEIREGNSIILDSGCIQVRIPASQQVMNNRAPGPIMQIARGEKWIGDNQIASPVRLIESIDSLCVAHGPLFITYQVNYRFIGGGSYQTTIRCILGYDFVEFDEVIQELDEHLQICYETTWDNFTPTHRYLTTWPDHHWAAEDGQYGNYQWRKIDEQFVIPYNGENPAFSGPGSTGNPNGELQYRLAPYNPFFAYHTRPAAAFWDNDDALGVFIHKHNKWQDNKYAIWASSDSLQVRFYSCNHVFSWKWPLVSGTRSTCIAFYPHQKDLEVFKRLEQSATELQQLGISNNDSRKLTQFPTTYTAFLHNRYVTLHLDKMKDWVLQYDNERPIVQFPAGKMSSLQEYEQAIWKSGRVVIATKGIENFHERPITFDAVELRMVYDWIVDGFCRFLPEMSEKQRNRLTALLLVTAYVCASEVIAPMQTSLGGHPNFLSDIKSVPAQAAFLFPKHPLAKEWADEFEKFIELNTRFHTRPAVPAWEAFGGRWTENLGIYVWAFLRPAILAEFVLQEFTDGKNRLAFDNVASLGDFLIHSLTAPFLPENPSETLGAFQSANEPRRVYPPQGAHAHRRVPQRILARLGKCMMRYRPLLAEYMFWASRPTDLSMEHSSKHDVWSILFDRDTDSSGTKPQLASRKYTGYGMILRANVDTAQEMSIHLQQIDRGPNYRWGIAAEGGCGVIYYYAHCKCYSHNGEEDVGDRRVQDTDFCSTFGVWKDGRYKSVGMNDLHRPMYDLQVAQFAEVLSREGQDAYSWPEYRGRSVMMVGGDYIVTYDAVGHPTVKTRFSWFVHKEESFPFIHFVKGINLRQTIDRHPVTELTTGTTTGRWYDGEGDRMAVVSHRSDLMVENTSWGCTVESGDGFDSIFRSEETVSCDSDGIRFSGTAGVVRHKKDGRHQLALFHGTRIGTEHITLCVDDPDLGISAEYSDVNELSGDSFGRKEGTLTLVFHDCLKPAAAFYIDGQKVNVLMQDNRITVSLPPGKHKWQWTTKLPVPLSPSVLGTDNSSGQARVFYTASAGADHYRIELSSDGGASWQTAGIGKETSFVLRHLRNGEKLHVRIAACNAEQQSEPSAEYPIYVTDQPSLPPDGLRLKINDNCTSLTWGEVLGVAEYRL